MVNIDEVLLCDEDSGRASVLITGWDGTSRLPQERLDLLIAHSGEQRFADALARSVSADGLDGEVADYVVRNGVKLS